MAKANEPGRESLLVGSAVGCLACDAELHFLPDSYPLVFRCANRHFLTLKDILDAPFTPGNVACESAPKVWEGMAFLFHRLAARALKSGHAFAAADFQEAANRVDQWVLKLGVLQPEGKRYPPTAD